MQTMTRVNYDELNFISKKFHGEGEDYVQLLSTTRQKLTALRSEWEGKAADNFFAEMENALLPAIYRLSQGLFVSQEVLNKIMKIVYEADQETGYFFRDEMAGGKDFGAGKFEDALGTAGVPVAPLNGASNTTDHFTVSKKAMEPFETDESETVPSDETPPSASGGGGGGSGGSTGLQGDLKNMGAGLGGQPASNASVGGASRFAESPPDHIFSGGGSSGGGGGELPFQGGGGGSGGESAASDSPSVAAGIAGVAGSAAVGGAAKALKDKLAE